MLCITATNVTISSYSNMKIYKSKQWLDNEFSHVVFDLLVLIFLPLLITQGLQWALLAEEEIAPSIIAMDGRRSRCTKSEHQAMVIGDGAGARQWKSHPLNIGENNFQDVSDAKLLRKLEAQGQQHLFKRKSAVK